MRLPAIEIYIDELVLHGFAPQDSRRIGEAVRRELQRLVSERGMPRVVVATGDMARIDAGALTLRPNVRPAEIGVAVAQAVYGGMDKE